MTDEATLLVDREGLGPNRRARLGSRSRRSTGCQRRGSDGQIGLRLVWHRLSSTAKSADQCDQSLRVLGRQLPLHRGHRLSFALADRRRHLCIGSRHLPGVAREVRNLAHEIANLLAPAVGAVAVHAMRAERGTSGAAPVAPGCPVRGGRGRSRRSSDRHRRAGRRRCGYLSNRRLRNEHGHQPQSDRGARDNAGQSWAPGRLELVIVEHSTSDPRQISFPVHRGRADARRSFSTEETPETSDLIGAFARGVAHRMDANARFLLTVAICQYCYALNCQARVIGGPGFPPSEWRGESLDGRREFCSIV